MDSEKQHNAFARDVITGLSSNRKFIPSKYFYDDNGSRIFRRIMEMDEYYPTRCEREILVEQSSEIVAATGLTGNFNVIELGCGDGSKTEHLLRKFFQQNPEMTFVPVDISAEAITAISAKMSQSMPSLDISPRVDDYFSAMADLASTGRRNLFMFLGGNIGNYLADERDNLLSTISQTMNDGDLLLIGFDLIKNPRTILSAYDDRHGITKEFNLNLLRRINTEFAADFDLDKFDFYCNYDPEKGEVNSYLVSLVDQIVRGQLLNRSFTFRKNELIWTEVSKKYHREEIAEIARNAGFKVAADFSDSQAFFCDSLWKK